MCHWLRVLLSITELDLSPGGQSYLVCDCSGNGLRARVAARASIPPRLY
jgi:hypothetical protein